MGEDGRGRVVQQRGGSLRLAAREAPDDQRRAEAVLEARIAPDAGEAREGRVLAAAVHPHVRKTAQRRREAQAQEKLRRFRLVNGMIVHYALFPSSQKATALAAATFSESTPCAIGIMTV